MKPRPYGPFEYSPIINRKKLEWPKGARVALWVIPNIEFFSLAERIPASPSGKLPDVPTWSARDYGNRVGVFRFMDVLDRYGIRATVALNSDVCIHHPVIIAEGNKRQWEWMGHNKTNTTRLIDLAEGDEPKVIKEALDTIARVAGKRPKGWLGSGLQETWNTLDILAAEEVDYVCDWANDDQPYAMTLDGGKKIVAIPYSQDINDIPAFERHNRTPEEFRDMICRQFDTLYAEGAQSGRVMAICLHPYLTGRPYRIHALDQALAYICGHKDVWLATGSEIIAAYKAQQ
ncbi:MAG TPA: polysaccharide deacetylase family protein [Stellaceae bacterium]|jgi:peptidoglycan/xylan/chitin deacetylase (PgdA/CDA1 family)